MHNLRKLILSRNYLSVLDHLHAKLGNVQKIVLSGNQLQSLKGGWSGTFLPGRCVESHLSLEDQCPTGVDFWRILFTPLKTAEVYSTLSSQHSHVKMET